MRLLPALALSVLPSALKVPAYRLLGMKIGRGVRIGFGAVLACDHVELDDGARIGFLCLFRANTLKMGKRAEIRNLVNTSLHSLVMRSQSTISSSTELAGDRADPRSVIYLGPASWIFQHCFVDASRTVKLGRNVGVGGGSYLFTHGMWLSKLDGFPVSFGDITIEDDVWLPWRCFIMPNVKIGSRAVLGAGSVVNKNVPRGALAAGVPAKVIREKSNVDVSPEESARILVELSETFAAKTGSSVTVESTKDADRHFIGGQLFLLLHKQPHQPLAASPTLNVVFGELPSEDSTRVAVWSLQDSRSSPYAVLPKQVRHWFTVARAAGVRFYPIDEDVD